MAMQRFVPGQQLGHYRLVRLLGQGGFADVYLGEHVHLNTLAAVKVLHTRLADEDVREFQREAQVVARLLHPNIIRVFDFGVEAGVPYLVMDHAPNGTLRTRYAKGTRVALAEVVAHVKQVGAALQYAHEQRIIHRDVKPENMLVGRGQEILLSDFGIALVTQSSYQQSTQNIAGTIAYMAPEQIQAHPLPASDQYALGIVVYEWLSGVRPFQGTYTEIAIKQTTVAPQPLRMLVPDISVEVEYVVMTALQKDAQRRFPSVGQFAEALERAAQQGMQRSYVPTYRGGQAMGEVMPWSRQGSEQVAPLYTLPLTPQNSHSRGMYSRMDSANAGQNGLVSTPSMPMRGDVVQGPGQMGWSGPGVAGRGYEGQRQAVAEGANVSRRALIVGGVSGLAVLGVGGVALRWLTQRTGSDTGVGKSLINRLKDAGSGTQTQGSAPGSTILTYGGHSGIVWRVRWSLDGRYIASGSMDGTMQVWTADKGEKKNSTRSLVQPARSDDYPWSLAWAPVNRGRVAVGFVDSTIQIVDMLSHERKTVVTSSGAALAIVAWSPDEKFLAAGWSDGTVLIYDTANWQGVQTYSGHTDNVYAVVWSPDGKYIASGSEDTTVRVWEPGSGKTALIYTGHSDTVMTLSWSPDSTRVVSTGGSDETAKVWNALSGQTLYTYTSTGGGPIGEAVWSHDGKTIAIYTAATVILFDAQKGSVKGTIQTGVVYSLSWSPDDSRLVTGDYDKTAKIWQVS